MASGNNKNNGGVVEKELLMPMDFAQPHIKDDNLRDVSKLWVGFHPFFPNTSLSSLSSRVGMCSNLKDLHVNMCASIPKEIQNCRSLRALGLHYCGRVGVPFSLPDGITMRKLTKVSIFDGVFDGQSVDAILSWLASCAPNLKHVLILKQSREIARMFIEGLSQPEIAGRFKNLRSIAFARCGLDEEDTNRILFGVAPMYPELDLLCLRANDIRSLKLLGESAAASTRKNNNNGPARSKLGCINLHGNPVFSNLSSPETHDHAAAVCLLKAFQRLKKIGGAPGCSAPTPEIAYWASVNEGGRFLVDGGSRPGERISVNLWPSVLERAYKKTKDATPLFYLLARCGELHSSSSSSSFSANDDYNNNLVGTEGLPVI